MSEVYGTTRHTPLAHTYKAVEHYYLLLYSTQSVTGTTAVYILCTAAIKQNIMLIIVRMGERGLTILSYCNSLSLCGSGGERVSGSEWNEINKWTLRFYAETWRRNKSQHTYIHTCGFQRRTRESVYLVTACFVVQQYSSSSCFLLSTKYTNMPCSPPGVIRPNKTIR